MKERSAPPPDRSEPTWSPGALDVTRWVEHRLHESAGWCSNVARLYGLEVIDPRGLVDASRHGHPSVVAAGPVARMTFLAESPDPRELVLGPDGAAACEFDAVVLAATRWEPPPPPLSRPGEHAVRRRARVVVVVGELGTASATRFEHDPGHVVLARGLACGGVAGVQLMAVWTGRRG
ncbi:MAG: hypothetical protein JWM12_1111 [Ilumatobacteraceae bacterium]|nr:hypothetical protein [Ilumatobacteraceae bacterium]